MAKPDDKGQPASGKKKNIHAGHRRRMRQRFMATGSNGFQDHELLEVMLYYAVPRKDVNPLAHALIDRFGSLENVLVASDEELLSVPGIGQRTVDLVRLVPQFARQFVFCARHINPTPVETPENVFNATAPRLLGLDSPALLLLLLNNMNRLMLIQTLPADPFPTTKDLMIRIVRAYAQEFILVECTSEPSTEAMLARTAAVQRLAQEMDLQRHPLKDYYIWGIHDREFISMRACHAL